MKKLLFSIFTLLFSILGEGCKPDEEPLPTTKQNPAPSVFFTSLVVGGNTDLGIIINDTISGIQYAGSGPKGTDGKMDTLLFIVEHDTETGGWMTHEFNEDYTPKETNTSTGHTIEYSDLSEPNQSGSIKVTETKSGNTVWEERNVKFNKTFYENIYKAREISKDLPKKRGVTGAELTYVLTSIAGCGLGVAGLSSSPLALAWGAYNTYQNCKSAKEAMENLYKGDPAFGCIKAMDNVNALSGFSETLSQGTSFPHLATSLVPAIINYGAQQAGAGQCDDEKENNDEDGDGIEDDLDNENGNENNPDFPWGFPFGAGSWGDPHLRTPDGLLYDFHGYGEFIFTKSTTDNFEVQVRLANPYSTSLQATLNTGIAVNTGEDKVSVIAKPFGLYINNIAQEINFDILPLKGAAAIKREINGNYTILTIRSQNGDNVQVRLDGGSYFDFGISMAENRMGKLEGLMGNYDGNQGNDLRLKTGERVEKTFTSLYPAYADSWRVEGEKSLFYYEPGTNTESFTKKDFPKEPIKFTAEKLKWAEGICRQAGLGEEPFISQCTFDVAVTEDPAMAKSAAWEQQNKIAQSLPPLPLSKIALQGNAQVIDNYIRLTEAKSFLSGQAFSNQPLSGDFETEFTFKISVSANGGGDGFAFLIAKNIPQLKPNAYPGKEGKLGYQGVEASLAVEFDTSPDAASDENANHIAIHTNRTAPNGTGYEFRIAKNQNILPLQDGMFHTGKIRYKNKSLTVYLDGAQVLTAEVDLIEKLSLEGNFYIGFTSSTSGSFGNHDIASWTIK